MEVRDLRNFSITYFMDAQVARSCKVAHGIFQDYFRRSCGAVEWPGWLMVNLKIIFEIRAEP